MLGLKRICSRVPLYGALVAVLTCTPVAQAASGKKTAGWQLYKNERNCSLAKSANGGFTYLTIWADDRQGLRFHDKAWQIEARAPVTALVTSGDAGLIWDKRSAGDAIPGRR